MYCVLCAEATRAHHPVIPAPAPAACRLPCRLGCAGRKQKRVQRYEEGGPKGERSKYFADDDDTDLQVGGWVACECGGEAGWLAGWLAPCGWGRW
jgi:hypothetical protein